MGADKMPATPGGHIKDAAIKSVNGGIRAGKYFSLNCSYFG
jgi:hypothetical protein